MGDVSIIIPGYNHSDFINRCLKRLLCSTSPNILEVIIVDNGLQDGTKDFLKHITQQESGIKVIRNDENPSFAASCNKGAKEAKGRFILFLYSDVLPIAGWLEPLVETIAQNTKIGAVGPKLLHYPNKTIRHAGIIITNHFFPVYPAHHLLGYPFTTPISKKTRTYKALTASCLLTRKDLFLSLGGFDEAYKNKFEDVDFCFKLYQQGFKLVYVPKSTLLHSGNQSPRMFNEVLQDIDILSRRWAGKIPYDRETKAKVSIIIPLYNSWEDLFQCIKSIYDKEKYRHFQILVIDNASKENLSKTLFDIARRQSVFFFELKNKSSYKPLFSREIYYIRLPENKGFAGAANEGIELALKGNADYVWLLNPDTLIDDLALYFLVSFAEGNTNIAIVGSKLRCYPETHKVQFDGTRVDLKGFECNLLGTIMPVPFVSGASMLIRGAFLRNHGLLREDYFLYYEDNEICLRALEKGYDVYYHPLSVVFHKGGVAIGGFLETDTSIYYSIRNGLFFWSEFSPEILDDFMTFISHIASIINEDYQKLDALLAALEDFILNKKGNRNLSQIYSYPKNTETLSLPAKTFLNLKKKFLETKNKALIHAIVNAFQQFLNQQRLQETLMEQ